MKYKKTIIVIIAIPTAITLLIWYTFTNATVYDESTNNHKKEFARFVEANKTRDKIKCFLLDRLCRTAQYPYTKLLKIYDFCEYNRMTDYRWGYWYNPCNFNNGDTYE